ISAQLKAPGTGAPQKIELSVDRADLARAVNQLAEKILAALKVSPTINAWNAADEAEQFFAEANWSYRWGLFAQAQAASESAWALGKHTRDVAVLRIQAYDRAARLPGDCIGVLAAPDETYLKLISRTLELFNQDTRIFFNESRPDTNWF